MSEHISRRLSNRFKKKFAAGSCVTFGRYPQNNGEKPEPIEWQVLDNDGREALLLSRCGLDCQPFHHDDSDVRWRDCDLRKWLNNDFLNKAFTSDEIDMISNDYLLTRDNLLFKPFGEMPSVLLDGISGDFARDNEVERFRDNSNEESIPESVKREPQAAKSHVKAFHTKDRIFCLTIEDILTYFEQTNTNYGCRERWHSSAFGSKLWVSRSRACPVTEYAVARGAWKAVCCEKYRSKPNEWWFENCCFWLRTSGWLKDKAAYVDNIGHVNFNGQDVDYDIYAVRPALRIKIKKLS